MAYRARGLEWPYPADGEPCRSAEWFHLGRFVFLKGDRFARRNDVAVGGNLVLQNMDEPRGAIRREEPA